MKTKRYILLFLCYAANLVCSNFLPPAQEQTKLFSGSIEFPYKMNYDLCLFYKGEKLMFETHSNMPLIEFSFVDAKDTHTVYFIITDGMTCCTEHANTLQSLQIAPECQYICYKLQAKREIDIDEHELLTWDILDHKLHNDIIPHNSLIFLFDPKLIAGLKIQSWKPENVFRIIPTVLISPRATIPELERSMLIARLAALDIDALHAKKITPINSPTTAVLTVMQ